MPDDIATQYTKEELEVKQVLHSKQIAKIAKLLSGWSSERAPRDLKRTENVLNAIIDIVLSDNPQ